MKRLRSFLIVVAILLFGILMPNNAYATLQSNPSTQYVTLKDGTTWISEFRKMETMGGAMGLTEQLNSDLTPKTDSNNIDVHMMKNTEYGAIAILSASSYGNPTTLQASTIKTTTGNKTGLYYNRASANKYSEVVAGAFTGRYSPVNKRYWNEYNYTSGTIDVVPKIGDATNLENWHGAVGSNRYVNANQSCGVYLRNCVGGLFKTDTDYVYNTHYSRGVAVCGKGL